mgnify:FL=1
MIMYSLIGFTFQPKTIYYYLVKACPGVCVAERIADYCEAVLNVNDLCKPGLRCCVSSDVYSENKQQNLTIINKNGTKPSDSDVTVRYIVWNT